MAYKFWKRPMDMLAGALRLALSLILLVALALGSLVFDTSPVLADRLTPDPDISLKQLKMGDITVQGYQATLSIWFPGYGDYEITEGSYIHLEYSRSELMNPKHSTVTVYLNGLPIASTILTEKTVQRTIWEIPLPKEKLKRDLNLIELRYDMHSIDDDDNCHGEEAKYSTVYEESFLHYQYASPLKFIPFPPPDLARFPAPFIRSTTPDGQIAVILPNKPSTNDYTAAASVAARFGQVAGGKPFTATLHLANEAQSVRGSSDLVVIGKPDDNALLEELSASLPLKYKRQDGGAVYVDSAGQPIDPDSGIIQEIISPWDRRFSVLVVSGGSDEGLNRAVRTFSSRLAMKALQGPYTVVTKASEDLMKSAQPETDGTEVRVSMKQLGLTDSLFDGVGSHATSFSFDVPPLDKTREAYFDLEMSYSPVLSPWVSSVRVSLNGTPIWSRLLDVGHSNWSKHRIFLPATALHPGVNSAKVQFDLYTRFVPECAPLAPERAWAVLHNDSSFIIPIGTARPPLDLANLPYPFVQNGTPSGMYLVLPDDPSLLEDSLQMAVAFGRQSLGATTEMKAGLASQTGEDIKRSYDLVGYGRPENNAMIAAAQQKLPLSQEGQLQRSLQKPESTLLDVRDSASLGFIQLIPSPWNDDRAMLVVSGTSREMAQRSSQALQSALPPGNVAIVGDDVTKVAGMKIVGDIERPAPSIPLYRKVYSAASLPAAAAILGLVGLLFVRAERRRD